MVSIAISSFQHFPQGTLRAGQFAGALSLGPRSTDGPPFVSMLKSISEIEKVEI
jgi:hypothetical protein